MGLHNIQPLLSRQYLQARSASGLYITDQSGKVYLDGSSGAITCSVGHSHPRVLEALHRQADRLQFVYRSQFASQEAEQLATSLYERSVGKAHDHTFFVNSGTEAIETAMKIAQQHWQELGRPTKKSFISRWKSYHGITVGALSLSGHPLRRNRFEGSLEKYPQLRTSLDHADVDAHASELEETIERMGANHVAAFVAEPIVGAAGTALTPPVGYYERMAEVCRKNEILFIADEVMTGLGRTGAWFGLSHWNTVADIVAIGKSLGAGYAPIAATMMTGQVIDPIRKGSGLIMSGHTYSGHPLSCAVAQAVLDTIESEQLITNVQTQGAKLKDALLGLQQKHNFITHVRGKGLMLGVEFEPSIKGLQARLIESCFQHGLLVYPAVGGAAGKDENGILIAPPFILNETGRTELVDKLSAALVEVSQHL